MGRDIDTVTISPEHRARFRGRLLENQEALRRMIADGRFGFVRRRVGVELEASLVGPDGDPIGVNAELLELLAASGLDFQSELGRFNIEFASPPLPLGGGALDALERSLADTLDGARGCADTLGARPVLIGILPTITDFDVAEQNISVNPRYRMLNDAMLAERGEQPHLHIEGADTLDLEIPSIAYAAACTSLQIHLEVRPEEFSAHWNAATAASAALVAASANAPLFLGRRLHHESRIAVFSQACDTRSRELAAQGVAPRVWFGSGWVSDGALELFEQNLRWFPALLPLPEGDSPLDILDRGEIPPLAALTLHNGTIYRWNRPVYGVMEGGPNLRIENRVMPAGPTIADVAANVALCLGLMRALALEERPLWERLPFGVAASNFERAARDGIHARLAWPGVQGDLPACELLLRLLPLAREGLAELGVATAEADRCLGIVEGRAHRRRNGAVWQLETWQALRDGGRDPRDAARELVRRYLECAATGEPVHTW
ncbi:MAG TPA: hypothetical protein VNU01_10285 [Egibacteraceae bacterium]|nr:hypothetical protein [Egibacteraceae bacterium]